MQEQREIHPEVRDRNGVRAWITGEIADPGRVLLQVEDGRKVLVAREALHAVGDGTYKVSFGFQGLDTTKEALFDNRGESLTVPVIQECVAVTRERVDIGRVLLHKSIEERTETIDEPVLSEDVTIDRVQKNEMVSAPPQIRYEGDEMIIPLVEEVLFVEKRLLLREEVRVKRTYHETRHQETVKLRSESVEIERTEIRNND